MKLFYVIALNKHNDAKVTLVEDISSEYDSNSLEIDLSFTPNFDPNESTIKLALFTSEQVALLKRMQSKDIHHPEWNQVRLKGEAVARFSRLFDYYKDVQYIEVDFNL